ncbi:MAG: RcnB family protein [Hoeflea sp.]|uniref:RcnB family protein n=1 Tax=Hoeflea sp. TaxID=1940281 RepID=UPI00329A6933|tara:strand:+ start:11454 stop:11813 length:360 start_codon:yes stop_codon:yes gene_type:complete
MKKAFITSIAALLMAVPLAQAQTIKGQKKPQVHSQTQVDYKKPKAHSQITKSAPHKVVTKKHWSKGQRMNDWKRHSAVSDYKRHGLRKPGHGQRWVKVDNQYVLISIVSGLIAGIAAAH